jgi:hypothetical protein
MPPRLVSLVNLPLRGFDGLFHHIRCHFQCGRQSLNQCLVPFEAALDDAFEPPQAFGDVLVPAATNYLCGTQAKFVAAVGNQRLYRQ